MILNESSQILIIVLTSVLTVLLILCIALVIVAIRLSIQLRRTAKLVADTTESISGIAQNIAKVTSPLAFAKIIKIIATRFKSKEK